jgi:hypothetical protein
MNQTNKLAPVHTILNYMYFTERHVSICSRSSSGSQLIFKTYEERKDTNNVKGKGVPRQAKVAQGVPVG